MPLWVLRVSKYGNRIGLISIKYKEDVLEKYHGKWSKYNLISTNGIVVIVIGDLVIGVELIGLDDIKEIGIGNAEKYFTNLFMGMKIFKSLRVYTFSLTKP
jgi:hypothetical protein